MTEMQSVREKQSLWWVDAIDKTAICSACGVEQVYETRDLAVVAVLEHLYRCHRDFYRLVICRDGRHGLLCDGNH